MSICRTVYEIFSVKEWRDLETRGRGRWRSLKMASFDRSYTTFYWSAIVSIVVCCIIFKLFDLENWVRGCSRFYSNYGRIFDRLWHIQRQSIAWLKTGLEVVQGHWKRRRAIDHTSYIGPPWPWKGHWRSLKQVPFKQVLCSFLFAFHSNYGRIFNRLWDIQRQRIAWPWKMD